MTASSDREPYSDTFYLMRMPSSQETTGIGLMMAMLEEEREEIATLGEVQEFLINENSSANFHSDRKAELNEAKEKILFFFSGREGNVDLITVTVETYSEPQVAADLVRRLIRRFGLRCSVMGNNPAFYRDDD